MQKDNHQYFSNKTSFKVGLYSISVASLISLSVMSQSYAQVASEKGYVASSQPKSSVFINQGRSDLGQDSNHLQSYTQASGRNYLSVDGRSNMLHNPSSTTLDTLALPELSEGRRFVEQYHHQALGKWSLQQLNQHVNTLDDAWVQEVLSNVSWDINAQARSQAPLALVIINDTSINAFAIPGGVIGLNVGTVLQANSLDEVASVLAHEVAHLSQRHYEHSQDANTRAMLMQIGGLLAAIAASSADGDAAAAIMMGSQTAAMDSRMAFSRDNEREADRIGMQILAQAGYDPRAMPRFFATLNQQNQLNHNKQGFLPSFIMSHPLSAERLSEAQSRANRYPVLPLSQSQRHQQMFDILKWRIKASSQQTTEAELIAGAKQSVGAKLALAYWYGKNGRYRQANNLLAELAQLSTQQQQKLQPLLAITQAQVFGYQGQWQQAEKVLQAQHALYPERRDLRLYLADVYLHLGKPQPAQALLKPLLSRQAHDITVLSQMQQASELLAKQYNTEEKSGLAQIATINALRYRSQIQMWRADYEQAQVSLQQAKRLAEELLAEWNQAHTDDQNTSSSNSLNHSGQINPRPLLLSIEGEVETLKRAKAFKP